MEISVQTAKDALWWVQDGLDNVDLNNDQYRRTVRCRDELNAFIAHKEQHAEPDASVACELCASEIYLKQTRCRSCGADLSAG